MTNVPADHWKRVLNIEMPDNAGIHYDLLMMQQKEARRKHAWVLPRKVGKMV